MWRSATMRLLATGVVLATGAGLLEVGILAVRRLASGAGPDIGPEFVWMIPAANVAVLMILGAATVAVGVAWRHRVPVWGTLWVFTAFAAASLLFLVPRVHPAATLLLAAGVATPVSRVLSRHWDRWQPRAVAAAGLGLLVVGVLAAAVHGTEWRRERQGMRALVPARAGAPNVLLIILDTVRAANLSLYGYERPTTPSLEWLAARGATFDLALSSAPWTLPSHGTLFTGRYPHELSTNWSTPLDDAYPTLAEVFRGHGYATGGFVANTGYASASDGLARGFLRYRDHAVSLGQIAMSAGLVRTFTENFRVRRLVRTDEHLNRQSAPAVIDPFLDWAAALDGRPFFAFLNIYDAHGPYLPPSPFDTLFGPGRAAGDLSPLHRWNWNPAVGHRPLTAEQLREEIDAYDGAIRYLDGELGRLFRTLEERGDLERTIVIVTSDHGEEFGEHGVYDHGNTLYLPSVHVPLVVAYGRQVPAGTRVGTGVSLRDVPATILDLAGIDHALPGQSLRGAWADSGAFVPSPVLAEVRHASGHPEWFPVSAGDMVSLLDDSLRYIRRGDGVEELFDVRRDVWERVNLATEPGREAVLQRLRVLVERAAPDAARRVVEGRR